MTHGGAESPKLYQINRLQTIRRFRKVHGEASRPGRSRRAAQSPAVNLFRSLATVSSFTLLSRVTGLVRDMLISRLFGASAETDAFNVAFRLPNLLRRLFGEGAFQQAFVPMLADVRAHGDSEPQRSAFRRSRGLVRCSGCCLPSRSGRCAGSACPRLADRLGSGAQSGRIRSRDGDDALDVSVHPLHVAGRDWRRECSTPIAASPCRRSRRCC